MSIAVVSALCVLFLELFAMFRDIDAWPFSSYPMFSSKRAVATVQAFRLTITFKAGITVFWEPRCETYLKNLNAEADLFYRLHRTHDTLSWGKLIARTIPILHQDLHDRFSEIAEIGLIRISIKTVTADRRQFETLTETLAVVPVNRSSHPSS